MDLYDPNSTSSRSRQEEEEQDSNNTCSGNHSWGYPVTTNSDACISYINSYYEQFLGYGKNNDIIYKAVEADRESVLANTLAAFNSGSKRYLCARSYLDIARKGLDHATAYEKMVFNAVSCLLEDHDKDAAFESHMKLLHKFSKDLVAVKRGQILCFYMGRADLSLQLVEEVHLSNIGEKYIHGMLSFALLEVGRMKDAKHAAMRGLSLKNDDPWCQHALCHVLQHECRFKEATCFMEKCSDTWNSCRTFMYVHNWWHVASCYLEGNADLNIVLSIYDNRLVPFLKKDNTDASEVYLNALGLLLNLQVRGHTDIINDKVHNIAQDLLDKSLWHQEWLLDLLALWAFSYANSLPQAELSLANMYSRVSEMNGSKRKCFKKVLMLAESLYYYGKSDYNQAYIVLGPGFNVADCKVIGASSEQLEVFEVVKSIVLINSGHIAEAIEALEMSLSIRSGVHFTWHLLERAYCLKGNSENKLALISAKMKDLEDTCFVHE